MKHVASLLDSTYLKTARQASLSDSENQQIRIFLEMAKFVTPHTTGHYEPSWGNFSDGKVELSSYSSDKIELLQHSARQDNRQQKS